MKTFATLLPHTRYISPPRRLLPCLLAGGVPVLSMELSLLLREYVLRNSCRLLLVTREADMRAVILVLVLSWSTEW